MYARIKTLFNESFVYSVGKILGRSFSVVTMPIFTRAMSVSEYGILSLLRPFQELLRIFFEMGASASAARFYYDSDAIDYRTRLFSTLFFLIFGSSLLISVLLLLFAEPLWRALVKDVPFSPYVVLVIFSALVTAPAVLTRTLFRVQGEARRFVKLDFLYTLSIAMLAIPAVVIFDMGALGPLLSTLIASTIFFFVYLRHLRLHLAFRFSRSLAKQMLAFGLPEIPVRVGNWMLKSIGQVMLQHYWSLATVAVFSVAFAVANILFELVINAVHWAIQPFYYQVAKEETQDKSDEIFAYVGTLNTTIILFFGLCTGLLGKELIWIFASSKYADAESIVTVLAISAIFQFLFFIPSRVFYLEKKMLYLTPLLLFAVVINIGCNLLLIPEHGAVGAAWANLIAFGGRSVLGLMLAQRVHYIAYDYKRIGKAFAVFMALMLARYLIPAESAVPELIFKLALLAMYPTLLYASGFFEERELRRARELFREQVVRRVMRS